MLKRVVVKCDGHNQTFTSKELIWNAIVNWVQKLHLQHIPILFILKKGNPLSKYHMESLAMRFSCDIEYYTRHPFEEMERIFKTIVLLQFNKHAYHHRKSCFKKTNECSFFYPKKIRQIIKYLWIGVQSHLNSFGL